VQVETACRELERATMRAVLVSEGTRPDGRALDAVRPIAARCAVLPRVHGSALFTRGNTQALCTATLGGQAARLHEESLAATFDESAASFYLQYFFPPSCVGEVGRIGVAGRREVGHGKLAERALIPAVRGLPNFPYTVRVESHITESNGSSSMASVCGGCLALLVRSVRELWLHARGASAARSSRPPCLRGARADLARRVQDAGVPMRREVAGVAMGLMLGDGGAATVLTDILGVEDATGDMDFKVAGDADSLTAFQMDIKVEGITQDVLRTALERAGDARRHILREMRQARPAPRRGLSPYCPRMFSFEIPQDKVGSLIGPAGPPSAFCPQALTRFR
jgi:polyribonucleotide nucleotidyltransferase